MNADEHRWDQRPAASFPSSAFIRVYLWLLLRLFLFLCCTFGVTWKVATHWPTRLSFSPRREACWRMSISVVMLNSPPRATCSRTFSRALMRYTAGPKQGRRNLYSRCLQTTV